MKDQDFYDLMLDISNEELKELTSYLADYLIEYTKNLKNELGSSYLLVLSCLTTEDYDKALEKSIPKLEQLITSVGGVTDPVGQFTAIVSDIIRSATSWIVDSVVGFIDSVVKTISSWISGAVQSITTFITDVAKEIFNYFAHLEDLFKTVVIEPISKALSQAGELLAKIPEYIGNIGTAVTEVISSLREGATNIIDMISKGVTSFIDTLRSRIEDFIASIRAGVEKFGDVIRRSLESISNVFERIRGVLGDFAKIMSKIFTDFGNYIKTSIETFSKGISSLFENFRKWIEGGINFIRENLAKLGDYLRKGYEYISNVIDAVRKGFESFVSRLKSALEELGKTIVELPRRVPEMFDTIKRTIIDPIIEYLKKYIYEPMANFFKTLTENVVKGFQGVLAGFQGFVNAILRVPEMLGRVFSPFVEKITEAIRNFASWIWEEFTKVLPKEIFNFFTTVTDIFDKIRDGLIKFFTKPHEVIGDFLKWIKEVSPDWFRTIIEALEQVGKWITDFFKDPLKAFQELGSAIYNAIPENIRKGIESVYNTVVGFFTWVYDWFSKFVKDPKKAVAEFFKCVYEGFLNLLAFLDVREFVDLIFEFGKKLWNLTVEPAKKLISHTLSTLEKIIGKVVNFISKVTELTTKYFDNPEEFFARASTFYLEDVLKSYPLLIEIIGKPIPSASPSPVRIMYDVLKEVVSAFAKLLLPPIRDFYKTLISTVFRSYIELAGKNIQDSLNEALKLELDLEKKLEETQKIDGGKLIYAVLFNLVPYMVGTRIWIEALICIRRIIEEVIELFIWGKWSTVAQIKNRVFGRIRNFIRRIVGSLRVRLPFLSTRVQVPLAEFFTPYCGIFPDFLPVAPALGGGHSFFYFLESTSRILDTCFWGVFRWSPWAITYWVFEPLNEPLRILIRYIYRDVIPFRVPTLAETVNIVRRWLGVAYATGEWSIAEKLTEFAREIYAMHGIPTYIIDFFIKHHPIKVFTEVKDVKEIVSTRVLNAVIDRFGEVRVFPPQLVYQIPTPSELARMMVRDIFLNVEEFKKAMWMHGYVSDVSVLYYYLHFRYPPPSRLWEFVCRGISGLLWYKMSDEERKEVENEAKMLFKNPKLVDEYARNMLSPIELNFTPEVLLDALRRYMKWHDYSRVPWIKNFTADNLIMIDTLADIPTKTDIRWMVRHGIFELLSKKGVTFITPIEKIPKMVLLDNPPQGIPSMDLTMMCRLLQATGLHPYWVPLVAVAETIYASRPERTLMRTGVLNIYRFAGMDYELLDKLMENLGEIAFKVKYFDIEKRQWSEDKWLVLPLMYLPAERKFIEMRGLLDRVHRALREMLSSIIRGFREHIISKEEGIKRFETTVEILDSMFRKVSKEIIGREIQLKFDKEYVEKLLQVHELEEWIYTVRRVRYYFRRILAWVLYRIAYAYVSIEDAEKILRKAVEIAKLTDYEYRGYLELAKLLIGMAGREYIPTPAQLSTIAEVVPEVRKFTERILRARNVPREFWDIWKKYIQLRPIMGEIRRVVSTTEDIYERFIITTENYSKFLEKLIEFGYERPEIDYTLQAGVNRRIVRAFSELVTSVRSLAGMGVYSETARKLAMKRINELSKYLPNSEEIVKMWKEYLLGRYTRSEFMGYIRRIEGEVTRLIIPFAVLEELLKEGRAVGLHEKEIELLSKSARAGVTLRAFTELVSSVRSLAGMGIYSLTARELAMERVKNLLQYYPNAEKLAKAWSEYLTFRYLRGEYTRLLGRMYRLYTRFIINDKAWTDFLKQLQGRIFSPEEIKIITDYSSLDRQYYAFTTVVGTVRGLVTLSEYSPKARKVALMRIYQMINALPVDEKTKTLLKSMWEEYIRVRAVSNEVRSYITELISAYADGVIDRAYLESELQSLKEWGLEDAEIEFILKRAELRKIRRMYR